MSRPLVFASLLLVSCAPAAPEPKTVVTPPKPVVAPPAPVRARWSAPSLVDGVTYAELDLGEKGVLQVGERGRRWLVSKGAVTPSPHLLPESLVDVQREGKGFRVLGVEGTVRLLDDPLGPPSSMRPSPARRDQRATFSAGKTAVVGVEGDGTLHRSTDGGVTWTKSKLSLLPTEEAVDLVANARGEVLVLLHPQRVLTSSDDGVTFVAVPTPGIGASRVDRDAHGDLWLEGALLEKRAKLTAGKLEVSSATPAPFAARPKVTSGSDMRRVLGDRIVTLREVWDPSKKSRRVSIVVETFGGPPGAPWVLGTALGPDDHVALGGSGGEIVVAWSQKDSTEIFRTTDGTTFQSVGKLLGTVPSFLSVAVAPSWIAVSGVCADAKAKACPTQVKVGTEEFRALEMPGDWHLGKVVWDAAGQRLIALGWNDDADGDRLLVGKGSKFELMKVDGPISRPQGMTLGSGGGLILTYGSPWHVVDLSSEGALGKPRFLPFPEVRDVDFAGEHGFAIAEDGAFETADAGRTWARIGSFTDESVGCTLAGCVQGEATRLGWDLPDPARASVAALAEAPKPKEPAPGAPLHLECKTTSKYKKLKGAVFPEYAALDGDIRLLSVTRTDEYATGVEVIKDGAPKVVKMLDAPKKNLGKQTLREWIDVSARGAILVRYAFESGSKKGNDGKKIYNPVDVDLAWYTASTGKVQKVKLPKLPPFRVGSGDPSAVHTIVDGGLLFMPWTGDAPLTFVQDDGKIVNIPRPPNVANDAFTAAAKVGDRIVLLESVNESTALVTTEDMGKTWSTRIWTLGEHTVLASLAATPTLVSGPSIWSLDGQGGQTLIDTILPLTSFGNDPPARKAVSPIVLGPKGIVACDAKARAGLRVFTWSNEDRPLQVKVDGVEADSMGRFVRVAPDGSHCVDMIVAAADSDPHYFRLYARADDLEHAFAVRNDDDGAFSMRNVSCK